MSAPSLVFYAINGMGLGHLNRTLTLARAVRAAEPRGTIRFVVDSPVFQMVRDSGFEVVRLPGSHHPLGAPYGRRGEAVLRRRAFELLLDRWRPDALINDLRLDPGVLWAARRRGISVSIVLRRPKAERLAALRSNPASLLVQRWLIPHSPQELPAETLPRRWRPDVRHLGAITRGVDPARVPQVRERYCSADQRLLVLTLGGGGAPEARTMASGALSVVRELLSASPELSAVFVHGPLHSEELPPQEPRLQHRRFEAELPELLAAADCVLCNAGYNTIRELARAGSPAVVVPLRVMAADDQAGRARGLVDTGSALLSSADPQQLRGALTRVWLRGELKRRPLQAGEPPAALGRRLLAALPA